MENKIARENMGNTIKHIRGGGACYPIASAPCVARKGVTPLVFLF